MHCNSICVRFLQSIFVSIVKVFVWALVNFFVSYDTLVPNQNISISLQLRLHLWYLCENCKSICVRIIQSIYARIRQSIWVRISYTCCASRQVCSFRLCCDYVPSIFRLCSVYILFLELINKCPIEIVQLLRNLKYFLHGDCEKVRGLNCELLLWISPTCKAGSRSCKAGSVEREGGRGGLCLNSGEGRRCQSKRGGRCFDSRHLMQPAQKLSQINFHALLLQRRVRIVHCVLSWNTCVAENTSQCTAVATVSNVAILTLLYHLSMKNSPNALNDHSKWPWSPWKIWPFQVAPRCYRPLGSLIDGSKWTRSGGHHIYQIFAKVLKFTRKSV